MAVIDVQEGQQEVYIGETVVFIIDTRGSVSNEGLDSAPVSVTNGSTRLYQEDGTNVAATYLSGNPSLSGDEVTLPYFTPTVAGYYWLYQPLVMEAGDPGQTMFARIKFYVPSVEMG